MGRKELLAFKVMKILFQSVLYGKMSDPPLIDSSDCYATWSGPVPLSNEDRGAATASKGKTVGFEKQNSVDQDMVRIGEQCICINGPQVSGLNGRLVDYVFTYKQVFVSSLTLYYSQCFLIS